MKFLLSILTIGAIYGTYDFIIRLSAGKITPILAVIICQSSSALTMLLVAGYQKYVAKSFIFKINTQGAVLLVTAGILISIALALTLLLFQNKDIKISSAIPSILVLRNVTVILLGITLLKEKLTPTNFVALILSLTGVYLLTKRG